MRQSIIILLCCTLLVVTGCALSKEIRSDKAKEFKERMLSTYENIEELSILFTKTTMAFRYVINNEEEKGQIFEDSRNFFLSSEVQEGIVKGMFVKEHADRNFSYPDVEISFSLGSKQLTDFKYTASYYGSNTDPAVVDHYDTWYYLTNDGEVAQVKE